MCLVGPLLYYQCILMLWACERKVQSNRTDGLGVESCWPCAYQRGVVEVPNWNLKSSKLETRKQEYNTYIALTYAASAMATETTAALITFLHTITSMLTKSPSSCYRLRLQQGVRHSQACTLLHKLSTISISDEVYNWIRDFFDNNFHCTKFWGEFSDFIDILASVIQVLPRTAARRLHTLLNYFMWQINFFLKPFYLTVIMFYIVSYLKIKYQRITLDLAVTIWHWLANRVFMITVILLPGCFLKGPID